MLPRYFYTPLIFLYDSSSTLFPSNFFFPLTSSHFSTFFLSPHLSFFLSFFFLFFRSHYFSVISNFFLISSHLISSHLISSHLTSSPLLQPFPQQNNLFYTIQSRHITHPLTLAEGGPALAGLTVTGAGRRQLEKLSMSVRSDIAHVHPKDRTVISREGKTIA